MESRTRQTRVARGIFPFILTASLVLSGCSMVKSESDVRGTYELRAASGKIVLNVSPHMSFYETIYWPSGRIESRSGNWQWAGSGISFDQLWIPSEFAPDYILQADSSPVPNRQPKYTEPGHWFVRAEKHWGIVTLPIFPNADINFEMVKR